MTRLVQSAVILVVAGAGQLQFASAKPQAVLEVARSFKDGGGYVWEGGSGAPQAIEHGALHALGRSPGDRR